MHDQTTAFSPARFFILLLAFITAAVIAGSLQDTLPPARYILTPRIPSDTPLTGLLPAPWNAYAAEVLTCTAGLALEMLVWFIGGLTSYASAVFIPAAVYRGLCFGFVLSMYVASSGSVLVGAEAASVTGFLLVTLILFLFAGRVCRSASLSRRKSSAGSLCRYGVHFLICTGAAFWVTVLCARL